MKKYIQYITHCFLTILIFSNSSCLKKDNLPDLSNVDPVVEFPLGGPGLKLNSLAATSTEIVDTVIAVYLASPDPLDKDISVTVQADPLAVASYNTANGTTYEPAPNDYYEIQSTQVLIKAGYRVGRAKVKVFFNRFDLTKNYMLALKISDAPGVLISGNFGKFLWAFNVKNPYHADYHETGQIILYNGPTVASGVASTRNFDRVISATTTNGTTVQTNIGDLGNLMNMEVNSVSNAVTVSPASSNSFTTVENNGSCNYDPATKTFSLSFRYFNAAGNLREVVQTMVRQ